MFICAALFSYRNRQLNPSACNRYDDGDEELLDLALETVRAGVEGSVENVSCPAGQHSSEMGCRVRDRLEEIVIGRRVSVYWPTEKTWFAGRVGRYEARTRLHWIEYDDGDRYRADVFSKRVKIIEESEIAPKTVQGCESKGDLLPGKDRSTWRNSDDGGSVSVSERGKLCEKAASALCTTSMMGCSTGALALDFGLKPKPVIKRRDGLPAGSQEREDCSGAFSSPFRAEQADFTSRRTLRTCAVEDSLPSSRSTTGTKSISPSTSTGKAARREPSREPVQDDKSRGCTDVKSLLRQLRSRHRGCPLLAVPPHSSRRREAGKGLGTWRLRMWALHSARQARPLSGLQQQHSSVNTRRQDLARAGGGLTLTTKSQCVDQEIQKFRAEPTDSPGVSTTPQIMGQSQALVTGRVGLTRKRLIVGDRVIARYSDCRWYPAVVVGIRPDGSVMVR
jgi:hypothetical protein